MTDKQKKQNTGKTINFAEKKKAYSMKHENKNLHKNGYNDNRVIQYDINKMREQINQQIKNKNKSGSRKIFFQHAWVKIIYIALVSILVILIGSRIYNSFTDRSSDLPAKFVSENTELSTKETVKYENMIDEKINRVVKASGRIDVITTAIHKNGSDVFASGYFTYPNEKDKIYFDSEIENDHIRSIVINGHELIK